MRDAESSDEIFTVEPGVVYLHAEPGQAAGAEEPAGEAAKRRLRKRPRSPRRPRAPTVEPAFYETLEVGSRGDAVQALQAALNRPGFLDGAADGIYGNGTAGAVSSFQESVGLEPTGVADNETQRKLYGDDELEGVEIALTGTTQTDHMRIDGLFVNEGYHNEDDENETLLYLFYTVFTDEKNLSIDSHSMDMTINGVNAYSAGWRSMAALYMPNYYYSGYLEDVNIGEELKVMSTFALPRAELAPGRTIALSSSQIPDADEISLVTDDIIFLSSDVNIAKVIDPEGYADTAVQLAPADSDTTGRVQRYLRSYYFDFYVNNITYRLEFTSNSKYRLYTAYNDTDGTYTVLNGFVRIENAYMGAVNYIPYTMVDGEVDDLDTVAGFSVGERYC